MARIAGQELNPQKRIDIALTKIYGVGRVNVKKILKSADIDASKRAKDLTEDEASKIQKILDTIKVEGDLRREISQNIKRLIDIGSWRGSRHKRGLPVRGQRTRTNARTRKGPRKGGAIVAKKTESKPAAAAKPAK